MKFICPVCHGSLDSRENAFECQDCSKQYPLHDGVPDFRVFPDPFLSFQEDRKRANIMLEALNRYSFPELLEFYWSHSDVTPQLLRSNFVRSGLLGEARADRIVNSLEDGTFGEIIKAERVLEIGSGTGNFLIVAAPRFQEVVGIDIGMRHLHVSRRRFMDRSMAAPVLACCCGEYLPFPDGYFDLIVVSSTLEFARDQSKLLSECVRTLNSDGALYLQTVNRYTVGSDPYAYLRGVGYLPRRWQARYVRWRRNASYENIRTLSLRELTRLAGEYFTKSQIVLPNIDTALLPQFSLGTRLQIRGYKIFRRLPLLRGLMKGIGPGWEALLRQPRKGMTGESNSTGLRMNKLGKKRGNQA